MFYLTLRKRKLSPLEQRRNYGAENVRTRPAKEGSLIQLKAIGVRKERSSS